jgi:hypothetical protein
VITFRRPLALVALVGLPACSLGTAPAAPEGSLRVLFIGNSLTYTNDLPRTIAQLAVSAGLQTCYCVSIAYPDFGLEDHYDVRDAVNALHGERWDFVVMQQGPSALPENRTQLILWAGVFGEIIDSVGAEAVMYGVWPQRSRSFDFPDVTESYRQAAHAIGGALAPAGEAWQQAWARDSTLPLYSADNFHPSEMGTYLAALVVFERVYARSPEGVQATAVVGGRAQFWPVSQVQLLQSAAAAAIDAEDARPAAAGSARRARGAGSKLGR